MFDVVGVGANSIDDVYRLPDYPQPDTTAANFRITAHLISPGGQTATVVSACAALGLRTKYVGICGNDEGATRVREELARRGVDTADAIVRGGPNPYAVILLDERQGERIVLWDRDARVALRPEEIRAETITSARLVHVDDVDVENRRASWGPSNGILVAAVRRKSCGVNSAAFAAPTICKNGLRV